jgi:Ca2+-binding EF-hand superfamily protein
MATAENKHQMLMEEFRLIDTDHDLIFSKKDLIHYLDKRNVIESYTGWAPVRSVPCQRAIRQNGEK